MMEKDSESSSTAQDQDGLHASSKSPMFLKRCSKCFQEKPLESFYDRPLCGVHQDELEEPLAVDHIHGTTYIRDLLCSSCNTGIGHLKDKPELLRKAANYIERYNAIQEQEDREVPKPIRTGHKPTTETET